MKKFLIVVLLSFLTVSTYAHDDIYFYLYPDTNSGVAVTGTANISMLATSSKGAVTQMLNAVSGWVADATAFDPEIAPFTVAINIFANILSIGEGTKYYGFKDDTACSSLYELKAGDINLQANGAELGGSNVNIRLSAGLGEDAITMVMLLIEWQGVKFVNYFTVTDPAWGECYLGNSGTFPTQYKGCVSTKLVKAGDSTYKVHIYLNNISNATQTDPLILSVGKASSQNGYPKFVVQDIQYSESIPGVSTTDDIVQNNEPDSSSVYLRVKAPQAMSEQVAKWFLEQAGINNDGADTARHILPLNELQNVNGYTTPTTMSYALKGTLHTSFGSQNIVIGYGGLGGSSQTNQQKSQNCTWIAYSSLYNRTKVPLDVNPQTNQPQFYSTEYATLPNTFIAVNSSNAIDLKHGVNIPVYIDNSYVTVNSETYNDYVAQGTIDQLFKDSDLNIKIGVNALNGVKGKMSLQAIPLTEYLLDQLSVTVQKAPNKLIDVKKYKASGFTGDGHVYWYDPGFGTADLITVDLVGNQVLSPKVNTDWQVRCPFNYTYQLAGKQLTTPFNAFQVTFTYNSDEASEQSQIPSGIILPTGGQEKLYNGRKYTVLTTEDGLDNIKKMFPDAVSVPVTVGAIGTKTDSTPVEKITFTPAPSTDYMVRHTGRLLDDANNEAGVTSSDNPPPLQVMGSIGPNNFHVPINRYIAPPATPIFNISLSSFIWGYEAFGVGDNGPTQNKYMSIWDAACSISSVQLDGPRVEDCIGKEGPFTIVVKDGYVTPVGEWATKFSVTGGTVDIDKSHPGNEIGIAFNYIWKGKAGNFVIEFGYDSTNKQLCIQNTYNVPSWMNVYLSYINGCKLLLLIENLPVEVSEENISILDIQTITVE